MRCSDVGGFHDDVCHRQERAIVLVLEFLDPVLASAGLVALGSIATGVLTNALWDLIKELLIEQGITKKTTYQEISLPDGTKVLIISVEETR